MLTVAVGFGLGLDALARRAGVVICGYGHVVDNEADIMVLNAAHVPSQRGRVDRGEGEGKGEAEAEVNAVEVAREIQRLMLTLKGEYMNETGVDYVALSKSKEFEEFVQRTASLRSVKLGSLSTVERKAFFINLYNALTVHGLTARGAPPSSVLNIKGFWAKTAYDIGGQIFTLDGMEHGILRANTGHPSSGRATFYDESDPRTNHALPNLDPRIHFSLNCGSKGCPRVRIFRADRLDKELDLAAKSFCQQECVVDEEAMDVQLSKIFCWYRKDFGASDAELLEFLSKYVATPQREALQRILGDAGSMARLRVTFSEYDWGLNSK